MGSYLDGIAKLVYNDALYFVDKLSSVHATKFNIQYNSFLSSFYIEYYFELNFSGSILRLSDYAQVINTSNGLFKKKNINPYYEFLYENYFVKDGFYKKYMSIEDRKRDDDFRFVGDYNRWFASCSGTEEALNNLVKKIENCLSYIDDNISKPLLNAKEC